MIPFFEHKTQILQMNSGNHLEFPPHLHIAAELLYVKKGTALMTIGRKNFTVSENELAVIFPNIVHSYMAADECEYIMAIFNPSLYAGFNMVFNLNAVQPTTPVVCSADLHPDISYAMEGLLCESCQFDNSGVIASYIMLILSRALPFLNVQPIKGEEESDIISNVLIYITNNYKSQLDLKIISKKFGISRYKISRIFSNVIGISFSDYINTLRVGYAQNALINTNGNILNIGFESGFQNQQSFNRVFKELVGASPKEYRKKHKQ